MSNFTPFDFQLRIDEPDAFLFIQAIEAICKGRLYVKTDDGRMLLVDGALYIDAEERKVVLDGADGRESDAFDQTTRQFEHGEDKPLHILEGDRGKD